MIRRAFKFQNVVPLMVLLSGFQLHAATLRVLVLDGKHGRPVRGRVVEVLRPGTDATPLVKGTTNQQGIFQTEAASLPDRVAVYVKGRLLCMGTYRGTSVQSIDEIMSVGVVGPNDCNPNVKHAREPGVLVLYVRRERAVEIWD